MNFLYLIIGFIFLVKGADLLVGSASKLAKLLGVPSFIVGITVVAFGTSAPEAVIGIFSAIKQTNQITLGNVIGSSIVNVALAIGITSIILPLEIERETTQKEIPFLLAVQVLLFVLVSTGTLISRIEGMFFLLVFALFVFYISIKYKRIYSYIENSNQDSLGQQQKEKMPEDESVGSNKVQKKIVLKLLGVLVLGLAGMVIGGNLIVDSSTSIAQMFGLSETLIGLTVVALGTSLPELVTCIVAAVRKEAGIAVGNIIGSNIFNIVFVLGVSSVINPIKAVGVSVDIIIVAMLTCILLAFAHFKKKTTRVGGIILIATYIAYIVYKILSQSGI